MRFLRFGVTLERLEARHLELVRAWRNSEWVRPYMRYRDLVGPDDQVRWFDRLDPRRDWYFCADVGGAPFGLFHVKGADRESGEAGGFVGRPDFIGRPEPAQATLALMDFAFLLLELGSLEAQYRAALTRVVRFNGQLGYVVFREEPDGFVRARVSSGTYFATADPYRRAAMSLCGTGATVSEPDSWLARRIAEAAARFPPGFELQLT